MTAPVVLVAYASRNGGTAGIAEWIGAALAAEGHMTFGGRLVPGARGPVARMLLRCGQGGDSRDPKRVTTWARQIAANVHAAEWRLV